MIEKSNLDACQTCSSVCCKSFTIGANLSPDQLKGYLKQEEPYGNKKFVKGLIYLGMSRINGNGKYNEVPLHVYTCKRFNHRTNRCMDYADRPDTCKLFPYNGYCQYIEKQIFTGGLHGRTGTSDIQSEQKDKQGLCGNSEKCN